MLDHNEIKKVENTFVELISDAIESKKVDLDNTNATEFMTGLIFAVADIYRGLVDENLDILGFTHKMNRLVVQDLMLHGEIKKKEENHE